MAAAPKHPPRGSGSAHRRDAGRRCCRSPSHRGRERQTLAGSGDRFPPPFPRDPGKGGRRVTSSSGHSAAGPRFTMEQKPAARVQLHSGRWAFGSCFLNAVVSSALPVPPSAPLCPRTLLSRGPRPRATCARPVPFGEACPVYKLGPERGARSDGLGWEKGCGASSPAPCRVFSVPGASLGRSAVPCPRVAWPAGPGVCVGRRESRARPRRSRTAPRGGARGGPRAERRGGAADSGAAPGERESAPPSPPLSPRPLAPPPLAERFLGEGGCCRSRHIAEDG